MTFYAIVKGAMLLGHVQAGSKKAAEKKALELIARDVMKNRQYRVIKVSGLKKALK